MMWRHREKTAISKPRREVWNGSSPHSPQKEPSQPASQSHTFSLQICETIHLCCLSPPVCGTLLCSPSKLKHGLAGGIRTICPGEGYRQLIGQLKMHSTFCLHCATSEENKQTKKTISDSWCHGASLCTYLGERRGEEKWWVVEVQASIPYESV